MNADAQASIALQKAQATQIYAGLGSWPTEVMARLVAGQLTEDGTYPNAGTSFDINRGERPPSACQANSAELIADYEGQGHDPNGWWSRGRKAGASSVKLASENEEGLTALMQTLSENTPRSIKAEELIDDGETWARQKIDFAGLPEVVRTFLQVAAGAADIPVTRLRGQSPAGLSSAGDHDTPSRVHRGRGNPVSCASTRIA